MNIAHMSDLHYCAKNLAEADRCFGSAVSEAIERGVDAAVITGDSTDHAMDAHAPAVIALARQLQRLADHCPVLMLQGTFSHEPPGLLRMFALIGAKHPITIADRIGSFGLTPAGFEPVTRDGDYTLVVNALPTLNKADVAAASGAAVDQAAMQAGAIISRVLRAFGEVNRGFRDRQVPTLLVSHGTVHNSMTEHGVPMAGLDHEFGVGDLFAADSDAVALGHIHKHQSWRNEFTDERGREQLVAYAGSIGRFHHGEEGDKHWLEWAIRAGHASFQSHVTPSRRTVDLFFEGPPDMDAIREAAAHCAGAFVRVRYEVDQEHRQRVDRDAIKALLSGCADVQIEGKTLIVERVRAPGISTAQSLAEKLAKWSSATACGPEGLQQRLTLLQTLGSDDLIGHVLAGCAQSPPEASSNASGLEQPVDADTDAPGDDSEPVERQESLFA
jgi:exonuclease SbcD